MRAAALYKIELTQRDLNMLLFMWKWKLVTTATVYRSFFGQCVNAKSTHRRLAILKKKGVIQIVSITDKEFAWCLSDKGFARINEYLPREMESGYFSESPNHDLVVTSVHLGSVIPETQTIKRFSEQQLRRLPTRLFPDWVPSGYGHRSDGYWLVPLMGKMRTVALEVEISQKVDADYDSVSRFYAEEMKVFRVVWVVRSLGVANSLDRIFRSTNPARSVIHSFVSLHEIESKGWQAPIILGLEQGKPLSIILLNGVSNPCRYIDTLPNLDARRFPYNLTAYGNSPSEHVCNRLPYRPLSAFPSAVPHSVPYQSSDISLDTPDLINMQQHIQA